MHSKHNFLSPHKFLPGTIFSIFTIFGYFQFPPKLCTVTCFTVVVYFSSSPPGLTLATKFLQQKDFLRRPLQLLSVKPRGGETKVHNHGKRFFDYFLLLVDVKHVLCIFQTLDVSRSISRLRNFSQT